jgi:RNA polymerase sigma factor (sigma-70 family)
MGGLPHRTSRPCGTQTASLSSRCLSPKPDACVVLRAVTDGRAQIYGKYAAELTRFATGLMGPADADDVVSAAVVRSMYSVGWTKVRNHRAYLYRAVLNEAKSWHRGTFRRRARERLWLQGEVTTLEAPNPEVLDLLDGLSIKQRAVIVLTYWSDLAPESIGTLLGISEGTVKRHLARAREKLRERLRYED